MPLAAVTTSMTEQQFEAQIRAAILHAFPWLPADQITHQTTFRFKFGHATIVVDGKAKSDAKARADVLVNFRGKPLAVFELKRSGIKLTADDEEQGLSYARMLHPRPPLVVVSNGKSVRLLETHSAKRWEPKDRTEAALAALITRGAQAAEADLKRAVDILMGSDPDIWMQAIRQTAAMAIDERTGGWDEPLAPFVRDFLLPRKVAAQAWHLLEHGHRLVMIEGEPLSGKSNALRELVERTAAHPALAVLYLDADQGSNLFEHLALVLSDALDWPLTPEEARRWLVNLSRANGPVLVIAVDNMGAERDDLRRDIEAMTSNLFGSGVRLVLAVDDTVAEQITKLRTGRSRSVLGQRASRLRLGPLDQGEFQRAELALAALRMVFVPGARHSHELRKPWILRAMAAQVASSAKYRNLDLAAAMSPVPGLDLIAHAREQFDVSRAPFALYRELAQAVLEDGQDRTRPSELVLELLEAFVIQRSTARAHLGDGDLTIMRSAGLIREARSQCGENIFVVRLPELMASEVARLLAEELPELCRADPAEAAAWLAGAASNLPLGDVIAAQALIDAAIRNGGLSLQLIAELLERPPTSEIVAPGTRTSGWVKGLGIVNMTLREDGAVAFEHGGQESLVEPDEDDPEEHVGYADLHPYLILSHLGAHRFEAVEDDQSTARRVDPTLLISVGACTMPLRRPGGDPAISSIPVHALSEDLSIVCHKAGVVEPITWSMVCFFGREPQAMRDQFIDRALQRPAPALLARLDIALRQTAQSADTKRAAWAAQVRHERLEPLLRADVSGALHP